MTSENLIFTKRFGILAADRQQTMSDGKTYTGVRKIFELSENHSCAVLINGNPDFQDVPIETLIGEFKARTDFSEINSVGEIKDGFLEFVSKNTEASTVDEYIDKILGLFKHDLTLEIDFSDFKTVISNKQRREICPFIKNYSHYSTAFDDIIPHDVDKDEYLDILWEIFSFELLYFSTGIVICGYDLDSHYPSFYEMVLFFNNDGKIVFELVDSEVNTKEPLIKALAINDEAYSFITGVHQDFIEYIKDLILLFNDLIIEDYRWALEKEGIDNADELSEILRNSQTNQYSKMNYYINGYRDDSLEDTTYSVQNVPPQLLSIFSSMLIQLTALKQKTSSNIESVSLSTDVLLISKTDGFKWVKNYNERI